MKSKLFLILPWPLKCSSSLWIYFSKTTDWRDNDNNFQILYHVQKSKIFFWQKSKFYMYIFIYFSTSWLLYIYIKCWTGGSYQDLFSFCLRSLGEISSWNQSAWTSCDVTLSVTHLSVPLSHLLKTPPFISSNSLPKFLFSSFSSLSHPVVADSLYISQTVAILSFLFSQHLMAYNAFYCMQSP